jgi:alpha-N-arabinofuranosidase
VLPITPNDIPTQTWQRPAPKPRRGEAAGAPPPPKQVPTLFFAATKSSEKGEIYLKVVNTADKEQPVKIELTGAANVAPEGTLVTLSSAKLTDTNSIDEPTKIVPATTKAVGLGPQFGYTFAPYSVNVLVISAK